MTAFVHHLSYDFRVGLRDKSQMLMNYLFPLIFFAMMGLLMTGINPAFKETLIPAMMVNAMMSSALLGMPNPIVSAREAGIFRSYKINGVPALSIVTIPVLSIALHMALVYAIITFAGGAFFGATMPVNVGGFILVALVATLAMTGIGMLIGVIAPNTRATVLLAQMFYLPSMMLGGMMFPASLLSAPLYKVSLLLPASHVMNAFRGLAMGMQTTGDPMISLAVLAAAAVVSFGLAVYLFSWDGRNSSHSRKPFLAALAFVPFLAGLVLLG